MSLTVQVPTVGQANSTEAVKVTNSLTNLAAWANGNIPGSDLSPTAAIARSQLAGGFGNLAFQQVAGNTSCVDGKYYDVTALATMTLPAPTANTTVGVIVTGATTATVVRSGSAVIIGLGAINQTSISLGAPGAYAVFLADGTNWYIVAGQQDTGWVTLPVALNVSGVVANYNTASYRLQGDRVFLRGAMQNNTGGNLGVWATLPAGARPTAWNDFTIELTAAEAAVVIKPDGTINTGTVANGQQLFLGAVSFSTT